MNKAIFLDRDGVINAVVLKNGKPYPPDSVEACVILPGVKEALHALKHTGFYLLVVTNQPDVSRGITDLKTVTEFHDKLIHKLPIDKIYTCFHDDNDECACRKPKPGLLFQAAKEFDIDLNASFMVGDRWRDISAGNAAGTQTIWINSHYHEQLPTDYDLEVLSLPQALPWITRNVK